MAKNDEESPDADNGTSTTTLSEDLAIPPSCPASVKLPRSVPVPATLEASSPPQPDQPPSPGVYQSPVSPLHYAGRVSPTG